MFEGLVNLGFNVFFGYIGLFFIVIVGVIIIGGIFSISNGLSSTYAKPKSKEKDAWQKEIEKVKQTPLRVLRDMGIAALVVIGISLILALTFR